MNQFIIEHPLITEKAAARGSNGVYMFRVASHATKPEVKKAVAARYKVTVTAVQIVNVKSKRRRLGQSFGIKPGFKKAIVTLQKGQKLDILPT